MRLTRTPQKLRASTPPPSVEAKTSKRSGVTRPAVASDVRVDSKVWATRDFPRYDLERKVDRSSIRERMLGGPGLLLHFARRGNSQPSPRKRSRPRRTLFALDLTQTSTLEAHSDSGKVPRVYNSRERNII
jgi:hypothetical protein